MKTQVVVMTEKNKHTHVHECTFNGPLSFLNTKFNSIMDICFTAHATYLSTPESRQQVNDRFLSQTATVESVSHCRVHEQTVIANTQQLLTILIINTKKTAF